MYNRALELHYRRKKLIKKELDSFYINLGIDQRLISLSKNIESDLSDRFGQIDQIAEYNQLKVLHAMQK